jgi:hypothetical protein
MWAVTTHFLPLDVEASTKVTTTPALAPVYPTREMKMTRLKDARRLTQPNLSFGNS